MYSRWYCQRILYLIAAIIFSFPYLFTCEIAYADEITRSTSLRRIVVEDDNGLTRIYYNNDDGALAFAADMHYALLTITKTENTALYEYYDIDGNPSIQPGGYYSRLYTYNNKHQNDKITYLGIDKKPIIITAGYSVERHYFNEKGELEKVYYLDTYEKPINTPNYGYGSYRIYNDRGENIITIYLDADNLPMLTNQGCAIKHMEYYDDIKLKGKYKRVFFFDAEENPIALSLGQYGMYKEYDEYGRDILITYLDQDGKPTRTNSGYTTVKKTFNEDDTVRTVMYYDELGNPIKLAEGQYGIKYEGKRIIYLDENGNSIFNLKSILYSSEWIVFLACILIMLASALTSKRINVFILTMYLFFVLYMTLLFRTEASSGAYLRPFHSYMKAYLNTEVRWGILNNILLFIPIGFILNRLKPCKKILMIPVFFSLLVEVLQYVFNVGTLEFDDLLNNSIGCSVGFGLAQIYRYVLIKSTEKTSNK